MAERFKNMLKHPFDERFLCNILDLPPLSTENEQFSGIFLAEHAIRDCVAFTLFRNEYYWSATPIYSETQLTKLADVAIEKGAKLLVTTKQIRDYPCLLTDAENLLNVYVRLISAYKGLYDVATVGVTGSRGKTTTTEFVQFALNEKNDAFSSKDHINSWMDIDKCINSLETHHKYYVQEVQEGPTPGAASLVSRMIKPDVAVITNIGTSHLEKMGSVGTILDSCLGIQDGMSEDGLLVLNGDDELLTDAETRLQKVYFGINNKKADYRAENIRMSANTIEFCISHNNKSIPAKINFIGEHNVYNALAAFAAGKHLGLTTETLVRSIAGYKPRGIRQNLVEINERNLYLDCYNAAPESMIAALKTLLGIPKKQSGGRHIAVLADMSQLGEQTEQAHEQVGEFIRSSSLEMLVCYGKHSLAIFETARQNKSIEAIFAENLDDVVDILKTKTAAGDIILVKGSRVMRLEQAVDMAFGTAFAENKTTPEKIRIYSKDELAVMTASERERIRDTIMHLPLKTRLTSAPGQM